MTPLAEVIKTINRKTFVSVELKKTADSHGETADMQFPILSHTFMSNSMSDQKCHMKTFKRI